MKKAIRDIIIAINDEKIPHFASIRERVIADCPNLPEWFKEKSPDYYDGLLHGAYAEIESLLHAYNAYSGYNDFEDVKIGVPFKHRNYHLSKIK